MYMMNNVIYVDFKKRIILHHSTNPIVNLLKQFFVNIFLYVKMAFEPKKVSPSCKRIHN